MELPWAFFCSVVSVLKFPKIKESRKGKKVKSRLCKTVERVLLSYLPSADKNKT
jgi:hypothetical protein